MKIEDITVEIRSVALGRLGQIQMGEIDDLKIIKRFRNVGNWSLSLAADYEGASVLAQAGRGLVVTGPGDRVLMSGPVTSYVKRETTDDADGMWYFDGVDDMVHLADGLCFPVPAAAVTAQYLAHDVYTGAAEDALRHYVNVNRGPGAPVSRRINGLVLEAASLGRGSTVIGRARFDQMGPFLDGLASSGGVGFDVAQINSQIQFQVYVPSDVSDVVRMDIDNDMLEETSYGFSAPSTTRPVIAGQGEMEERLFLQKTTTESLAAEAAWGRKIETFKDRRDTPDPAELEQEADTLLDEGGKTVTSLNVKPADENTMRYAIDWYLGDIVGVVVDGQELKSIVTEAIIFISADGVRIGATIGEPAGFDFESKMIAKQQDQETRIQNLEKNEGTPPDPSYAFATDAETIAGLATNLMVNPHGLAARLALIGSGVKIQDTAPTGAANKDLWWSSADGSLNIFYDDGVGAGQWVEIGGQSYNDTAIINRLNALESKVQNAVIQVVQVTLDAASSFVGGASNSVFLDIAGLAATITPKFATSKILVRASVSGGAGVDGLLRLSRGATPIGVGSAASRANGTAFFGFGFDRPAGGVGAYEGVTSSMEVLDAPATISPITYKVQASTSSTGQTIYINRTKNDAANEERAISTITLMEVAQ